jgi:hypothetical protein
MSEQRLKNNQQCETNKNNIVNEEGISVITQSYFVIVVDARGFHSGSEPNSSQVIKSNKSCP